MATPNVPGHMRCPSCGREVTLNEPAVFKAGHTFHVPCYDTFDPLVERPAAPAPLGQLSSEPLSSRRCAPTLQALIAFYAEHRCGELTAKRHVDRFELRCSCGAVLIQPLAAWRDEHHAR